MSKDLAVENPTFAVTILSYEDIMEMINNIGKVIGIQNLLAEKVLSCSGKLYSFPTFADFLEHSSVEVLTIFRNFMRELDPNSDDPLYLSKRNKAILVDNRKFELTDMQKLDCLMQPSKESLFRIIGAYQFEKIGHSVKVCIGEWINLSEILEIIDCFSQGESKFSQLKEILFKRIRKNILLDDIIFYSNIANIIADTEDHKPMTHKQIDIAAGKRLKSWLKLKENNPKEFLEFFRNQITQRCLDFMGTGKLLNIHLQEIVDSLGFDSGCRGFGQIYHYQKDKSGKVTIKPKIQFI